MSTIPKPPEILDKIVDVVLSYKPKPKAKARKKQKCSLNKAKVAQ